MKCLEQLVHLKAKLFLVLLLIIFNFSYGKIIIEFKGVSYVDSPSITLKDIATVKSENRNLLNYLNSIKITDLKKEKERISKDLVLKKLEENYISPTDIVIKGNFTIVVIKKTKVDQAFLKDEIKKYISNRYKNIKIEDVNIPKVNLIFLGKPKIKFEEKRKTDRYIYFDIYINNKRISATTRYYQVKKIVIAKKFIPKGKEITLDDIKLAEHKIKKDERYYSNIENAIGKRAKYSINEGEAITYRNIEDIPLVIRNTNVEVIYKRNDFIVKIIGRALQNGKLKDIIKVRNLSSGKIILCEVIGKNKVRFLSGRD